MVAEQCDFVHFVDGMDQLAGARYSSGEMVESCFILIQELE